MMYDCNHNEFEDIKNSTINYEEIKDILSDNIKNIDFCGSVCWEMEDIEISEVDNSNFDFFCIQADKNTFRFDKGDVIGVMYGINENTKLQITFRNGDHIIFR